MSLTSQNRSKQLQAAPNMPNMVIQNGLKFLKNAKIAKENYKMVKVGPKWYKMITRVQKVPQTDKKCQTV